MELVEGAPLGEHFNSLKEKRARFSEERIWHIFIQVNFQFSDPSSLRPFFFLNLFYLFIFSLGMAVPHFFCGLRKYVYKGK